MCFGSACPDLHLPIPADSQILTPSTRPAVVTHTVMLPARRSACKIPSLENRHVWLSTAQSSPGPPNLARIAIMLPNLRNAWPAHPFSKFSQKRRIMLLARLDGIPEQFGYIVRARATRQHVHSEGVAITVWVSVQHSRSPTERQHPFVQTGPRIGLSSVWIE